MRVKFVAPGIIPGDYLTADLDAVPRQGDTVLLYTESEHAEELLTVSSVVWAISPSQMPHYAHACTPEVVCARAENPPPPCCCSFLAADECCGACSTGRHNSCVGPLTPLSGRV